MIMRLIFLVAVLVGLVASAAQAQDRIALVIGNPRYAGSGLIGNADDNADTVTAALRGLGFEVTEVIDVDRAELQTALESWRFQAASGPRIALIYYCGYAATEQGWSFLLPADFATAGGLAAGAVPLNDYLQSAGGSAVLKVALLDWRQPADAGLTLGPLPMQPAEGTVIAAISDAGETDIFARSLATRLADTSAGLNGILQAVTADIESSATGARLALTVPPSGIPDISLSKPPDPPQGESVLPGGPAEGYGDYIGSAGDTMGSGVAIPGGGSACPEGFNCSVAMDTLGGGGGGYDSSWLDNLGNSYITSPDNAGSGGSYEPAPVTPDTSTSDGGASEGGTPPGSGMTAQPPGIDFAGGTPSEDEITPGVDLAGGTPSGEEIRPGGGDGGGEVAGNGSAAANGSGDGSSPPGMAGMSDGEAWASVANSDDVAALQMYVRQFPNGQFVFDAYRRIVELTPANLETPPVDAASADDGDTPLPSVEPATPGDAVTALPPPPVTTPTTTPETVSVTRFPTLDAPEEVAAGESFTVSVALTQEQLTPDVAVTAGPTTEVTPEGGFSLSMPAASEQWPIDIDLLATGFDLADGGAWSQRVTLYKAGDSDIARFTIKARKIRTPTKERQLIARLYREGAFLGSVARPILVVAEQGAASGGAPPPAGTDNGAGAGAADAGAAGTAMMDAGGAGAVVPERPFTFAAPIGDPPAETITGTAFDAAGETRDVPDLEVTINYDDPDRLGEGTIYIHSRHIGPPVVAEFSTPEGMADWLNAEYARLVSLGLKVRGAVPLNGEAAGGDAASQKRFILRAADGFGRDLYRNYVPDSFKQVFWSLKSQGKLKSIQITSNSPVLPWELVVPESTDGAVGGFLGIDYRLARWAPRAAAGQVDRPLDQIAFTGVATIAPPYENNDELPFQKVEVDALSKLAGFRLVDGDFSSFERLVGEVSTGFIHFSGHGEVNDPGSGAPVFAIRLLDQALDPTTWRALSFAPHDKGNPFFFFNACDSGRAQSIGGFVQGWGPAVLASGASGFIGGMWPLTDRTAASFSTNFYGDISGRLKDGPVYVAEVLQGVRAKFYETGDPTYLAYTFYGNANLQVVSQ